MSKMSTGSFPNLRLRRNRQASWVREIVAENHLEASDLIMPFFVIDGKNKKEAIKTLSNNYRFSVDLLVEEVKKAADLGIVAIMLFPYIAQKLKNDLASESYKQNNLISKAVKAIKKAVPEIGIICDVALDPYTKHGHDGLLSKNGQDVDNDATLKILCKQALCSAKAGCDAVAPSDMMDGRIGKIREYLDKNNYQNVNIISYSVKYASNFYGPFRDAVGSKVSSSNFSKKTYQMDFRNGDEALREIALDISEGADMAIIKPGLPYLDIISKAKSNFNLPILSYQVSGEYAMLKLASQAEILDFEQALFESLIAFKRAGASAIITYGAMQMAKLLKSS